MRRRTYSKPNAIVHSASRTAAMLAWYWRLFQLVLSAEPATGSVAHQWVRREYGS